MSYIIRSNSNCISSYAVDELNKNLIKFKVVKGRRTFNNCILCNKKFSSSKYNNNKYNTTNSVLNIVGVNSNNSKNFNNTEIFIHNDKDATSIPEYFLPISSLWCVDFKGIILTNTSNLEYESLNGKNRFIINFDSIIVANLDGTYSLCGEK